MKITRILVISLIFCNLLFSSGNNIATCLKSYEDVIKICRSYAVNKFYLNFDMITYSEDKKTDNLNFEIWYNNQKSLIKTRNYETYSDGNKELTIFKKSKSVFINNPKKSDFNNLNSFYTFNNCWEDSLEKYVRKIECYKNSEINYLDVEFIPEFYNKHRIKKIVFLYDLKNYTIKEVTYFFVLDGKRVQKITYQYISFYTHYDLELADDVLNIVYLDGKLRKGFENFFIKDLRNPRIKN